MNFNFILKMILIIFLVFAATQVTAGNTLKRLNQHNWESNVQNAGDAEWNSLMEVLRLFPSHEKTQRAKQLIAILPKAQLNRNGWNALMFSALRGDTEITQILMDAGANINFQTQ